MASSIGCTARSEYEHELGAPVAVPLVWRRCLLLNVELLLYKHISRASIKQSVDGFCIVRLSNASRKVCSPRSLSIFGNILTTSNDTRIAPCGRPLVLISSINSKRWPVSLILDGRCVVKGAECISRKRDKFSMAVLHPVVSRRTGVLLLCVLYRGVFFPGCASSLIMKSFQFTSISFLPTHFSVHLLTFSIWSFVGSTFTSWNELRCICSSAFRISVSLSTMIKRLPLSCCRIIRSLSGLNRWSFLQLFKADRSSFVRLSSTCFLFVWENKSLSILFKNVSTSGMVDFGGFHFDFGFGGSRGVFLTSCSGSLLEKNTWVRIDLRKRSKSFCSWCQS